MYACTQTWSWYFQIKCNEITKKFSRLLVQSNRYKYSIDKEVLVSVLKKCPNIRRVRLPNCKCDFDLEMISKYCRRVTKLVVPKCLYKTPLMSFATKHGMWLQEFIMDNCQCYNSFCVKDFLRMCQNLTKIHILLGWSYNDFFDESDILMKLEVIGGVVIEDIEDSETYILELLVNKYSKRLKGFNIVFNELSSDELKTCFAHISRFESLQSLEL